MPDVKLLAGATSEGLSLLVWEKRFFQLGAKYQILLGIVSVFN